MDLNSEKTLANQLTEIKEICLLEEISRILKVTMRKGNYVAIIFHPPTCLQALNLSSLQIMVVVTIVIG